ncbi:MFS transporter [Rhodococcus wratislaviensis]|uniref:Putative major facilitator superfamily transporter n=1 Tax=Rhodococcus wratislaviensis NBRC 100605 TaxID=1219028 RepID=X0RK38_RHOWR|nr:MFS transporter [Rhodococcus wratislaviensis]GAF51465.1 putative major facilitator superfamily transporter [Rhodococcus wratislaviensis NBRC 100605]
MENRTHPLTNPIAPSNSKEVRRAVVSSYLGTSVEFYDFILYLSAASLIFGHLFFDNLSPAAGTIASLGTLAAGYLSRPLGAVVFGHYGDRIGRKAVLVATLLLMGTSTALIGILPTSEQIGAWAPLLLVVLRLLQGFAVGGEWGGASLMTFEHAPPHRRGFATSFVTAGGATGAALAGGSLALVALLPDDDFYSWGWRVPFLLSAVLVVVGLWTRLQVSESPLFLAEKLKPASQQQANDRPLLTVLRRPGALFVVFTALLGPFVLNAGLVMSFGLSYARTEGGLNLSAILGIQMVSNFVMIFSSIAAGALSDIYGRKRVMTTGVIFGAVLAYPFLLAVGSGQSKITVAAFIAMFVFVMAPIFGPISAFMSEQFSTSSRYTGASLGYQAASTIGGGFAPLILASLLALQDGGTSYILVFVISFCIVSGFAISKCAGSTLKR